MGTRNERLLAHVAAARKALTKATKELGPPGDDEDDYMAEIRAKVAAASSEAFSAWFDLKYGTDTERAPRRMEGP